MQKIHFTKMHGAGNDYIYVDATRNKIANPSEASIVWSDRHKGIGSDGLVLIDRPTCKNADFRMRIFNADGSEAMMCGNASRCIGKYLYEKGLTNQTEIRLETMSGIKILQLHLAANADATEAATMQQQSGCARKTVESVTVDMLEPLTNVPGQYLGGNVQSPVNIIGVQPSESDWEHSSAWATPTTLSLSRTSARQT